MNEGVKTMVYCALGLAVLLGAIFFKPAAYSPKRQDGIGEEFFPDWEDVTHATALDILSFDEERAYLKPFRVAKTRGIWTIPSKNNYPADADRQFVEAIASLIGLKRLNFVSDVPDDHELYGVVDPESATLQVGAKGVGIRVVVEGDDNNKIFQLIVGKAKEGDNTTHYVRVPGEDTVWEAVVGSDRLSTRFEDWIEKDLLKLNAFDIKELMFDDYSVDAAKGAYSPKSKTRASYDVSAAKWTLAELSEFDFGERKYVEVKLEEGKELNSTKLNEIKNALDQLQIVDVARKPTGLSADLKADKDFADDIQNKLSLQSKGFYAVNIGSGREFSLLSNEGEVVVGMNDGVEYLLRFGSIASGTETSKEEDKSGPANKDEFDQSSNRYLMLTSRFNQDLIAPPILESVPEENADPDADAKPDGKADGEESSPEKSGEEKSGQEKSGDEKSDEGEQDSKSTEESSPDAKSDEENSKDDKSKEDKSKAGKDDEKKQDEKEQDEDPAIAKIRKENLRRQTEYDDKVAKGKQHVETLNKRFADWYYVISEATYNKIHVKQSELFAKKQAAAGGVMEEEEEESVHTPLHEFQELIEEGVKGSAVPPRGMPRGR